MSQYGEGFRYSKVSFGSMYPWLLRLADQEIDHESFGGNRLINCLKRGRISTFGELAERTQSEIFQLPNFGQKTFEELHQILQLEAENHPTVLDTPSLPTQSQNLEDLEKRLRYLTDVIQKISLPKSVSGWAHTMKGAETLGDILLPSFDLDEMPEETQKELNTFLSLKLDAVNRTLPAPLNSELLHKFCDHFGSRDSSIFYYRCIDNWFTLQEVGDLIGLTRERVRQLQKEIEPKYRELLTKEEFAPLRWVSFYIRIRLLPFQFLPNGIPDLRNLVYNLMKEELDVPDEEITDGLISLIIWCAELNVIKEENWLILDQKSHQRANSAFRKATSNAIVVEFDEVAEEFKNVGIKNFTSSAEMFLESENWKNIKSDKYALWKGDVGDKSVIILEIENRPLTGKEINNSIKEGHSDKTIQNILHSDSRFIRTDKFQRYALATWGMEEYSGIYQEICERIERGDGAASVAAIIEEFTKDFGVSKNSIMMNLENPVFKVSGDVVTFSTKSFDPINPSLVRNSIKTQEGWGEKLTVRKENLEGYSFNVSNHIAYENGIRPDSSLRVPVNIEPSWEGEASIIWRIKSVNATTDVGRLSKLLARDFLVGDDIIIVPTPTEVSVFKPDQLDGSDISNYPDNSISTEKFEVTIKDF